MKKQRKTWGTKTYTVVRINFGRWYLEFGKILATYRTPKELVSGIKSLINKKK